MSRDLRLLGAGWIAGCLVATLACLASIALETRAQKGRNHARINEGETHVQLGHVLPARGCHREARHP